MSVPTNTLTEEQLAAARITLMAERALQPLTTAPALPEIPEDVITPPSKEAFDKIHGNVTKFMGEHFKDYVWYKVRVDTDQEDAKRPFLTPYQKNERSVKGYDVAIPDWLTADGQEALYSDTVITKLGLTKDTLQRLENSAKGKYKQDGGLSRAVAKIIGNTSDAKSTPRAAMVSFHTGECSSFAHYHMLLGYKESDACELTKMSWYKDTRPTAMRPYVRKAYKVSNAASALMYCLQPGKDRLFMGANSRKMQQLCNGVHAALNKYVREWTWNAMEEPAPADDGFIVDIDESDTDEFEALFGHKSNRRSADEAALDTEFGPSGSRRARTDDIDFFN